mgnify:CR=1 FL=1
MTALSLPMGMDMEPVSEQVLIPMVEPSGSITGISPPQGVNPGRVSGYRGLALLITKFPER